MNTKYVSVDRKINVRTQMNSVCTLLFDPAELGVVGYFCSHCKTYHDASTIRFETEERLCDRPMKPICPTCGAKNDGIALRIDRTGMANIAGYNYPKCGRKPAGNHKEGDKWVSELLFDEVASYRKKKVKNYGKWIEWPDAVLLAAKERCKREGIKDVMNFWRMMGFITNKVVHIYEELKIDFSESIKMFNRINACVGLVPLQKAIGIPVHIRLTDMKRMLRYPSLVPIRLAGKFNGDRNGKVKDKSGVWIDMTKVRNDLEHFNADEFSMRRGALRTESSGDTLWWDPSVGAWVFVSSEARMVPYIEDMGDDEDDDWLTKELDYEPEELIDEDEDDPFDIAEDVTDPEYVKIDREHYLHRLPGYRSNEEWIASFKGPAKDRLLKADMLRIQLDTEDAEDQAINAQ